MSYCVNCGVELESSLKKCPLCNTPVINPNVIPDYESDTPFPATKGQVESVSRKDIAILISILLSTTAVTCGLLNLLVFRGSLWSVSIIGLCLLIWVFCIPFMIYRRLSPYLSLLFDGFVTIIYLAMLSLLTGSNHWFWGLGIPITALVTLLLEAFTVCVRRFPRNFLNVGLYFFINVALLCVGIELICRHYLVLPYRITWSAVVLTVCTILSIAIITVLTKPRLRNEARKRLHF